MRAPGAEPEIAVGVAVAAASVEIGGQGRIAAVARGVPAFGLDDGRSVTLTADGRAVRVSGATAGRYESLTFTSTAAGRYVTVNGRAYRGVIDVTARDGAITTVNRVPLEQYLFGVVNAEMGHRTAAEREALAAQAVVSRTYALKNRGRFASEGYDLRGTVTDQAYLGVDAETPDGIAAVRETAGQVLTYDGQLIDAFFHSTCGGSTASPEEVFRTVRNTPYLRPVSDRKPDGGYYCDISPHFRWTVTWDGDALRGILRRTVPAVLGIDSGMVSALRDVYVRRTGPSGRATDVRIRVERGEIPVSGADLRAVFVTPDGRTLGSSAVTLHAQRDGDRLIQLTADGAGWGHGVGMCQWGAVGRARAGQDYRTILSTYFPGTTIARWY